MSKARRQPLAAGAGVQRLASRGQGDPAGATCATQHTLKGSLRRLYLVGFFIPILLASTGKAYTARSVVPCNQLGV